MREEEGGGGGGAPGLLSSRLTRTMVLTSDPMLCSYTVYFMSLFSSWCGVQRGCAC